MWIDKSHQTPEGSPNFPTNHSTPWAEGKQWRGINTSNCERVGRETGSKPHKWVTSPPDSKWAHNRLHQFSPVGDRGQDGDGVPLGVYWYRRWVPGGRRGVEVFKAGRDGGTEGYRCFQLPTNSQQFPPLSDHTSHCEADGSPEQRGVEIAIVWLRAGGEEQEEVGFHPSALFNLSLSPCSFYQSLLLFFSFFFFSFWAKGRNLKVHFNFWVDVDKALPESRRYSYAV